MRSIAIVTVMLVMVGCGSSDPTCEYMGMDYAQGAVFPAGDGCNTCSCTDTGVSCTEINCAAQPDANPAATCGPTGGCPTAPLCGAVCCNVGEQCVGGECRCGTGPACAGEDRCESVGPLPESFCGSVCCSTDCPQ